MYLKTAANEHECLCAFVRCLTVPASLNACVFGNIYIHICVYICVRVYVYICRTKTFWESSEYRTHPLKTSGYRPRLTQINEIGK